jgi:uncharacterized protein YhaN
MSEDEDSTPDGDGSDPRGESGTGSEEELARKRRELDQRERGLEDFADELDEREQELNERARELRKTEKQLAERADELDGREKRIAEREQELDDREVAIEERERELTERADELDEKERTLEEYVSDSIRETVSESVSEAMSGYGSSNRFGRIGSLILALVGVTLIVAGVLSGFSEQISMVPRVFNSETANLGMTVLLLFSGLATNLAAVAD